MKVDFFLAYFFPLLLGIFNRVDKRVGFPQAIDLKEYAFSYSRQGDNIRNFKIWKLEVLKKFGNSSVNSSLPFL